MRERDQIGLLRAEGKAIREMGRILGRSPSTISRELKRNGCAEGPYLPHEACSQAVERQRETHRRPRLRDPRVRQYVHERLVKGWSPELIAGRLKLEDPELTISHEAIYQWIYAEASELIKCLARRRRIRRPRHYTTKPKKHYIPCRVSIDDRPAAVASRQEVGHWEVDTVGAIHNNATIHIMTERKSRYSKLTKLDKKITAHVQQAMIRRFSLTPRLLKKSFTYDNGKENCGHVMVNYKLGTKSYFCHPYHSWEKGTVENTIGLIRRFFPKKTNFASVMPETIKKVEDWLNHRPRKCLKFKTPYEVYQQERVALKS